MTVTPHITTDQKIGLQRPPLAAASESVPVSEQTGAREEGPCSPPCFSPPLSGKATSSFSWNEVLPISKVRVNS